MDSQAVGHLVRADTTNFGGVVVVAAAVVVEVLLSIATIVQDRRERWRMVVAVVVGICSGTWRPGVARGRWNRAKR